MSLETAAYISQLNTANPPSGDPIANAADHLRLIKGVLQGQFPNLGAAQVTSTASQLSTGVVPTGGVIMWTGTVAPTGWGLCNGSTYAKMDGSGNLTSPNLVDRFIVGGGNLYTVGTTGGSLSVGGALTVGATALTQAQIPALTISISDPGHTHSVSDPGHNHSYSIPSSPGASGAGGTGEVGVGTGYTGSSVTGISIYGAYTYISASTPYAYGQTHTHSLTGTLTSTPPYFALAFIVKL